MSICWMPSGCSPWEEQINEDERKISCLFFLAEMTKAHWAVLWYFLGPEGQVVDFSWKTVRDDLVAELEDSQVSPGPQPILSSPGSTWGP